ncbi:MAG: SMP-30/gluconolactonase/LRE family protein [Prevotellaceae bacterium]|jgi:sugar lactone lactonase YvrE|nr:SMP-30/gluconolactonase/LRE family protein [Prevotellaceae bacterium]
MKTNFIVLLLSTVCWALIGCSTSDLKQPVLFGGKPLPESYNSPDGCTIGTDGCLYVSINQVASAWKYPGKIARILPEGKLEDFFVLPVNGKTGKSAPLGLVFASDGNLYVSDNQSFCTGEPNQAGVIRVVIENGKPCHGELVVSGLNASNGITRWKNWLYVAETNLGTSGKYTSGVYRFSLDELVSGDTLIVTGVNDPHLILSFETKSKEQAVGANGIGVDSQGNLYVNNFGDVEVMKYTFDNEGKILTSEVFCRPEGALSLDGMQIDKDDNLWIADFSGNAVLVVDTKTRTSRIVAKSKPFAIGENGELDTPSECIRWGDKVYVSNIDLSSGEQIADKIQTISVISLK